MHERGEDTKAGTNADRLSAWFLGSEGRNSSMCHATIPPPSCSTRSNLMGHHAQCDQDKGPAADSYKVLSIMGILDAHPTDCATLIPLPPHQSRCMTPCGIAAMHAYLPPPLGALLQDPPRYWTLKYSPPPLPPMPSLSLTGGRDCQPWSLLVCPVTHPILMRLRNRVTLPMKLQWVFRFQSDPFDKMDEPTPDSGIT